MHNPDNSAAYYLLIGILSLIWISGRNLRGRYRPRPARRLPLDMARLRWIAYRKSLAAHLLFLPPVAVIMGACYATERMSAAACLAAAVVALIFPAIDLLFILYMQRTPMQSLPPALADAMETFSATMEKLEKASCYA